MHIRSETDLMCLSALSPPAEPELSSPHPDKPRSSKTAKVVSLVCRVRRCALAEPTLRGAESRFQADQMEECIARRDYLERQQLISPCYVSLLFISFPFRAKQLVHSSAEKEKVFWQNQITLFRAMVLRMETAAQSVAELRSVLLVRTRAIMAYSDLISKQGLFATADSG